MSQLYRKPRALACSESTSYTVTPRETGGNENPGAICKY